jgi:TolA-binding protein
MPPTAALPPSVAPTPPRPDAPAAPPAAAQPPGARPHTGALLPQDVYQAAYIDFSKGNYVLAISGFREFLRRYVEHELAANAQYWIGESHLAMARGHIDRGEAEPASGALQQAVQEFRRVLANYPRSDKAPAALYKEALALLELKQPAQAQARLQYLIETFPQAEETMLARERLAALRER